MPDINSTNNSQVFLETLKYLGSFLFGGIAFLLKEKYQNKRAVFTKRVWGQRLGFSVQSQDWGDIQILYNNEPSNNLHTLSAEIINTSKKDFPKLLFEFSVPIGCTIYRHLGQLAYDDLTRELSLQKEFNDQFIDVKNKHLSKISSGLPIDTALQNDINYVTRHRRFDIPLIQSNAKTVFTFLVEDINDKPYLNISILEENLRLVPYQDETERKENRRKWLENGGLAVFLFFSYPIYRFSNSISMAILLMIANIIFCGFIALGIYYLYRTTKKMF